MAVLLWVFVASNQSLLGKFPNQIKIQTVNLSTDYQAFLDEQSVQVSVMADRGVFKSLTADSFSASVDLAGLKEGTYELDVRVSTNIPEVQITKIEPAKVFVNIEKVIVKSVSLTPKVEGDAADGMVLGQITLEPDTVQIKGPSSYVETISEANAIIKLNGESESFERDVQVSAVNPGEEAKGVSFLPANVTAKVTIIKGGNNKTVGIKVKTKGLPKENYYLSKITATPPTIDIVGQRSILSNVNFLETEEVDIGGASDQITKDVNLILPSGVSLQRGSVQKVKVELSFALIGSTKSVAPKIVALNLNEGLRLISYSPSDLSVSLSGPQTLLNSLGADDIRLELNMAGKTAGTYNVTVDSTMIRVPPGLAITSIVPTTLSFILGN